MGNVDMRKEVYAQDVSEGTQLWVLAKGASVEPAFIKDAQP